MIIPLGYSQLYIEPLLKVVFCATIYYLNHTVKTSVALKEAKVKKDVKSKVVHNHGQETAVMVG